jgi:hypothetical protein
MSDKPIAGLVAALAVAPLCLVCALGPAAFVAAAGSVLAWAWRVHPAAHRSRHPCRLGCLARS